MLDAIHFFYPRDINENNFRKSSRNAYGRSNDRLIWSENASVKVNTGSGNSGNLDVREMEKDTEHNLPF